MREIRRARLGKEDTGHHVEKLTVIDVIRIRIAIVQLEYDAVALDLLKTASLLYATCGRANLKAAIDGNRQQNLPI